MQFSDESDHVADGVAAALAASLKFSFLSMSCCPGVVVDKPREQFSN